MTARGAVRRLPSKDETVIAFADYLGDDKEEISVIVGDHVKLSKIPDDQYGRAAAAGVVVGDRRPEGAEAAG